MNADHLAQRILSTKKGLMDFEFPSVHALAVLIEIVLVETAVERGGHAGTLTRPQSSDK